MRESVRPFSLFVVKIHSRCNIACTYCYVYEHADQSWRSRPIVMTDEIIDRTAARIGDHARTHDLELVRVVLHGGEPLLAGPERITRMARELRAALPPTTTLDLRLQTNGVLLADDEALCRVLMDTGIKVSISLDGDRAANDRHRLYRDGRSSFDEVVRAVRRIGAPRYRRAFAGLLCTIDPENDPEATYEALADLDPPRIDFLLPHANWDNPPWRPAGGGPTPYADWLIAVHRRWTLDGRRTPIRVFESIRSALAGTGSLTEALGTEPGDFAVVETDGAIEQADSLKSAYDGAPRTGFDVLANTFDEAARHPGFAQRSGGTAELCQTCRECPVVEVCGGGLYAHRYGRSRGFDNPSVHCADLLKTITHVASALERTTSTVEPAQSLQMSQECFDVLAGGLGDEAATRFLADASENINRALVAQVLETAREAGAYSRRTWEAVEEAEHAAPEGFRLILAHPYVRVWANQCLDLLAVRTPDPAALGHLAALAVSAAARGGADLRTEIAVTGGSVHLPTLGTFRFEGGADAPAGVELLAHAATGTVTVERTHSMRQDVGSPVWLPARRLTTAGFGVALEDADAYRACHHWPVGPRQAPDAVAAWQDRFADAWRIIETDHAGYAPAIRAGLSTIVPLAPRPGLQTSSTARQAFGSIAVALPSTPDELALLMIHEFQHVKLGALMDLLDLHDPAATRLFHAPWRRDGRPRPVEAFLQGTYAHVAVTDVWRARWNRDRAAPEERTQAGIRYVRWRELLAQAVETLAESGCLTELGMHVIESLGRRAAAWLDEPMPPEIHRGARLLARSASQGAR